MQNKSYKECVRCVMNTVVDKNIRFDIHGLCTHCSRYDNLLKIRTRKDTKPNTSLGLLIQKIKKNGKGKKYDCLIGVSGGVDSTYLAYLAKELGLRPLAVHFDNGWNSELSINNIENTLKRLNIDLVTNVINWPEFRDLQKSFLMSSTPDGDVPSDHGIFATLWKEAVKHKIKYILFGMNFATESMSIPEWSYGHSDWKYISEIHKKFGNVSLKTYPHYSIFYIFYVTILLRIQRISLLNYLDYDKNKAENLIKNKLGWRPYGGKHHESIYTRFWQGYVLPKKFGIDKRYAHFSDLINSGQMSRKEAVLSLKKPTYPLEIQKSDYEYVLKKLAISRDEFERIISLPPKSFKNYKNNHKKIFLLKKFVDFLRSKKLYPK